MSDNNNNKLKFGLIEIHIVDHCNLNCKGCSHFSNISEEYYISSDVFESDLNLLSEKFNIKVLGLIGGEPLLHPKLPDLITLSKNILPNTSIIITTNGMLIPTLTPSMLDFFQQNNVKFIVSKYPINSDYFSKILDILGDRDLLLNIFVRNYFRKYININNNSDINKTYSRCIMKHCFTYSNKHLYHCPFALYVRNFNKKFNAHIIEDPGIDLTKVNNNQIKDYFNHPIPTCKCCTFENDNALFEWDLCNGIARAEDWICNT